MDHAQQSERPADTIPPGQSPKLSEAAQANRKLLDEIEGKEAISRRLAEIKAQIGQRYAGCRLDNFEIGGDAESRQRQTVVVSKLKDFCSNIENRITAGVGMSLFGSVGTGKDHLLAAMMLLTVSAGFRVQWRDGSRLAEDFRSLVNSDDAPSKIMNPLIAADVLAISDPVPPTGGLSPYVREKLFSVVDARYRAKRPTWLTLNVSNRTEADDRLSGQIVDRITDGAVCLSFDWPSFRLSRRWTGERTNV